MNHLSFNSTPISRLNHYSQKYNCDFIVKRDDLFAEAGGGNKARMLQYILYRLTEEHYDVLVTAGSKSSNFNRACALMCAKLGITMHLVMYASDGEKEENTLNGKLCELANVIITHCKKEDTAQTIQDVIKSYRNKKVLSVYGGGRSLEGIFAYYEAVEELSKQIDQIDHLFVACGTGTTLTGICAGMQKWYPKAQVHAISISRVYAIEQKVLEEDMQWLNAFLGTKYDFANLHYYDDYLCGGYGLYNDEIMLSIKNAMLNEGLFVDPCYTGKAWYGMESIISKNLKEYEGKNVLFLHTGGLFNLLSLLN